MLHHDRRLSVINAAACKIQTGWRSPLVQGGFMRTLIMRYRFVHSHVNRYFSLTFQQRKAILSGTFCMLWTKGMLRRVRHHVLKFKGISYGSNELSWLEDGNDATLPSWPSEQIVHSFMHLYLMVLNPTEELPNLDSGDEGEKRLLDLARRIVDGWNGVLSKLDKSPLMPLENKLVVPLFQDMHVFLYDLCLSWAEAKCQTYLR